MKSYQPSGIHLAKSIELFARMIDGRINTNKHKKRAPSVFLLLSLQMQSLWYDTQPFVDTFSGQWEIKYENIKGAVHLQHRAD